jgi:hypothetical protein
VLPWALQHVFPQEIDSMNAILMGNGTQHRATDSSEG